VVQAAVVAAALAAASCGGGQTIPADARKTVVSLTKIDCAECGDQIVEVKIVVPRVQDERSKEILREFEKLNPQDPREELMADA